MYSMAKRTTVELDEALLARAKAALGASTTRATIEEALRRAADEAETAGEDKARRQRAYLDSLAEHAEPDVLASEDMWR